MRDPTTARGLLAGLGAGVTFGVTVPLAKRLGAEIAPPPLAALLYLGAAMGLAICGLGRDRVGEPGVRRADAPTLAAMIVVGGFVGPVLLLVGLHHVSAVAGALLLNLEAPFTMLLAVAVFGEHLAVRAGVGATLVLAGAVLLSAGPGGMRADLAGVAAIAGACVAWAVDTNLAARLSLRDPVSVARWKTAGAGLLGAAWSALLGHAVPPPGAILAALGIGFVGYGVSLVLAVRSMRALGAARQAACFAVAPFVGAVAAVPLLGESVGLREAGVAALMGAGLALLWREDHAHVHTHEPLVHEHLHTHDEHHRHPHAGLVDAPHAHRHVHEVLTHAHPHASDAHHRHRH